MKKVFVDTNIVIDFYQAREPFYRQAAVLFQLAVNNEIILMLSATTIVNAFYLLRKNYERSELYTKMKKLLMQTYVVGVDAESLIEAIGKEWKDYEDCVQYMSAKNAGADVIITRNIKDFENTKIPVMTPSDFFEKFL